VARPGIIGWLEWLRVGAIVGVVVLHVLSPVAFAYDRLAPHTFAWINLADSASRWCVPVFIMVSGALALGRREAPAWDGRTLGRRVARVGIPLIAWSLFYWWFGNAIRGRTLDPFDFAADFISGYPYYHLYFLFVIIGLYLITPVLRRFTDGVSDLTLGIAALAALAWSMVARGLLEVGLGHSSNAIDLFTRFLGYYLAGAWLFRLPLPSFARYAPLVAVGAIVLTAVGTAALIETSGSDHQAILYSPHSPLTILASMAIFLSARRYLPEAPRWVITIAGLSFGIYLVHPAILYVVARAMPLLSGPLPMIVTFVLQTAICLVVAGIITAVLARIPWVSTIVGGAPPRPADRPAPS
jgi:surface polysaccharide O-acyltransferase-like enzyme